ncbi:hypothetical protein GCM10023172_42480 [Hymenobacter ginsengisoli]|uniref:Uncharacterized protein n=2 Tax=Hymenobacteraceae TaxID=1853232 RepID=A0ABP8QTC8_9BACT|nr:hypothetical protein [Hymenobacter sp. KCTC 23674]
MDESRLLAEQRDRNLYQRLKVKQAPFFVQNQAVQQALRAVEEVHSLPPLETERYKKVESSFRNQAAFGQIDAQSKRETGHILLTFKRDIAPEQLGLTILHELGHLIDLLFFEPVNVLTHSDITKNELEPVLSAAQSTRAWQQYQGRLNLDSFDDDALYLSRPEEIWARAYAQYIAEKSGNENLLAAVKEQATTAYSQLPEHWSTTDFMPIRQAIDTLFQTKGWLR